MRNVGDVFFYLFGRRRNSPWYLEVDTKSYILLNFRTVSYLPMTFDFLVTLRKTLLCDIVEISVFEPFMYTRSTYSLTTCST